MCENCAACVLESERGRGEINTPRRRSRRAAVIEGSVQQHAATDHVLFRCPHLPGCGGCEVHAARGFYEVQEERVEINAGFVPGRMVVTT
jgi:hypothetical protein